MDSAHIGRLAAVEGQLLLIWVVPGVPLPTWGPSSEWVTFVTMVWSAPDPVLHCGVKQAGPDHLLSSDWEVE